MKTFKWKKQSTEEKDEPKKNEGFVKHVSDYKKPESSGSPWAQKSKNQSPFGGGSSHSFGLNRFK